jgi:PAS domain-containing protein
MGHGHDHTEILDNLSEQFQPILEGCPQGVYLWLEPGRMVCNEKLAQLFGTTVPDWCQTEDFLARFVDPKDQKMFGENYGKHVGNLQGPVRFRFKAKRKDGTTFNAETDMIPITYEGHPIAYHFVRAV